MIEGCPSSLVEIVLTVVASEDVIAQDGGTLKLGERGGLAVLTFPAKSSNAYPASISAFKSLLKMPLRRDLAEVAPPRNPIPPSAIVI